MLKVKRVYEKPQKGDGARVLIDGLWPRGVTKQSAKLDLWCKDIAPSTALRTWFSHDPKKWATFKTRYGAELRKNKKAISTLREFIKNNRTITLLYAAKDEQHNHALVLRNFLMKLIY